MIDFIYRFDPNARERPERPADSEEACRRLREGNREFARLFDLPGSAESHAHVIALDPFLFGGRGEGAPAQSPFAVILGCSDARAPAELLFSQAQPDVLTVETIRFLDHAAMSESFDLDLLDAECVRLVKEAQDQEHRQGCELPHAYRKQIYDLIIGEATRLRPDMPIAFCRETFEMWDEY